MPVVASGCSGSATALQRLDRGLPCEKDGSKGHGPSRVGMASANSQASCNTSGYLAEPRDSRLADLTIRASAR
jgi:hypothetical protein